MSDTPERLATAIALPAAVYLAVWVHELGHVIAGRMAGLRITSAGTGTGGRVVHIRVAGTALYAATRHPFQGLTFTRPGEITDRWREVVFCCGGIAANALVAAIVFLGAGLVPPPAWWSTWWLFGACNVCAGVGSAIPHMMQIGPATLGSDGALLVGLLLRRDRSETFAEVINSLRLFGGLWRVVGDRHTLGTYSLIAARGWAERGKPDLAAALLAEAERVLDRPSGTARLYGALTRVWLAAANGRADEADRASDEAAALVRASGWESLRLWVELDRAQCRVQLGDVAGARAVLDRLDGSPGLLCDSAYRRAFEALAYRVGRADTPPAAPPSDDAVHRIWLYSLLAGRAAEDGAWVEVERLARCELAEIDRLSGEMADPSDRGALAPLRASAEEFFRRAVAAQGRDPNTEVFAAEKLPPDPGLVRRERRRYRLAVAVLLAGGASVVVAGGVAIVMAGGPPDRKWGAVALLFYALTAGFFGAVAALFTAASAAVRWRAPARLPNYGTRSLTWVGLAFGLSAAFGLGVLLVGP